MSWFDMTKKTPWDQKIEKRTANIGFLTRANALRDPTPMEKARALAIETKSWQESIGAWKRQCKISAPYDTAKGAGINLKADFIDERPEDNQKYQAAIKAYVETPMEIVGKFKDSGIDTTVYKPKGVWQKITSWLKNLFPKPKPQSRQRLSKEFLDQWHNLIGDKEDEN